MNKRDQEWAATGKREDIKEMSDVSCGMASAIVQVREDFDSPRESRGHAPPSPGFSPLHAISPVSSDYEKEYFSDTRRLASCYANPLPAAK